MTQVVYANLIWFKRFHKKNEPSRTRSRCLYEIFFFELSCFASDGKKLSVRKCDILQVIVHLTRTTWWPVRPTDAAVSVFRRCGIELAKKTDIDRSLAGVSSVWSEYSVQYCHICRQRTGGQLGCLCYLCHSLGIVKIFAIDNCTLRCSTPPARLMSSNRENAVTVVGQFKQFTVPDDRQIESVSVIVNAAPVWDSAKQGHREQFKRRRKGWLVKCVYGRERVW